MKSAMRSCVIRSLIFYQGYISVLLVPRCRFYPSCSQYAKEAIESYGIYIGLLLAFKRIIRCMPGMPHGLDFVDKRKEDYV